MFIAIDKLELSDIDFLHSMPLNSCESTTIKYDIAIVAELLRIVQTEKENLDFKSALYDILYAFHMESNREFILTRKAIVSTINQEGERELDIIEKHFHITNYKQLYPKNYFSYAREERKESNAY